MGEGHRTSSEISSEVIKMIDRVEVQLEELREAARHFGGGEVIEAADVLAHFDNEKLAGLFGEIMQKMYGGYESLKHFSGIEVE